VYLAGGDSWFLYALIVSMAAVFGPVLGVMAFLRLRFAVAAWRRGDDAGGPLTPPSASLHPVLPASARAAQPGVEWALIAAGAVTVLLALLTLVLALQAAVDPDLGLQSEDFLGPAMSTAVLAPLGVALLAEGTIRLLRLRARGRVWDLDAGPVNCTALPTATSMLLSTRWILPVGAFLTVGYLGSDPSWPAPIVAALALLLAGYEVNAARRHRARLDREGLEVVDRTGTCRVPWSEVVGLAQDGGHGYLIALTGDRCIPIERLLAHTARNEPLLWTVAQRAAGDPRLSSHQPVPTDDAALFRMQGLWRYVGIGSLGLVVLPLLLIVADVLSMIRGRLSAGSVVVTAAVLLLLSGLPFARFLVAAGRGGIRSGDQVHHLVSWLRLAAGLLLCAGAVAYCVLLVARAFH
jgi:hypothetical protein